MIYILTGAIGTGKSTALEKWAKKRNDVFGIISLTNQVGKRIFKDLDTGEEFPMEANSQDNELIYVGRYCFLTTAFKRANNILKRSLDSEHSGYIIIDELGKLEMASEGLHASAVLTIDQAIQNSDLNVILVVRSSLLTDIQGKYGIENATIVDKHKLSEENFGASI